jgi:hypothetical protein
MHAAETHQKALSDYLFFIQGYLLFKPRDILVII